MPFIRNLILLIFLSSTSLQAQEIFRGIVVDSATFSPLPYVTVAVKGKGTGTITNDKGNFEIKATRNDTLVFSFVGYSSIEYLLFDYEPGLIRLAEKKTVLKNITVGAKAINPYEGMFDDANAKIAARRNRFYYSRAKKEKRKLAWLREDNMQAHTYVDVVINNPDLKNWLMKEYALNEKEYYDILAKFNEKNSQVMYYITAGELVTLIKNFYARSAPVKNDVKNNAIK